MRSTVGDSLTDSRGGSAGVQARREAQIIRETDVMAGDGDHIFFFIFCPSVVVQAFYPMSQTLPAALCVAG
jgi:hypothetical protein